MEPDVTVVARNGSVDECRPSSIDGIVLEVLLHPLEVGRFGLNARYVIRQWAVGAQRRDAVYEPLPPSGPKLNQRKRGLRLRHRFKQCDPLEVVFVWNWPFG